MDSELRHGQGEDTDQVREGPELGRASGLDPEEAVRKPHDKIFQTQGRRHRTWWARTRQRYQHSLGHLLGASTSHSQYYMSINIYSFSDIVCHLDLVEDFTGKNRGAGRLNNLPKITQLVRVDCSWGFLFQRHSMFHCDLQSNFILSPALFRILPLFFFAPVHMVKYKSISQGSFPDHGTKESRIGFFDELSDLYHINWSTSCLTFLEYAYVWNMYMCAPVNLARLHKYTFVCKRVCIH